MHPSILNNSNTNSSIRERIPSDNRRPSSQSDSTKGTSSHRTSLFARGLASPVRQRSPEREKEPDNSATDRFLKELAKKNEEIQKLSSELAKKDELLQVLQKSNSQLQEKNQAYLTRIQELERELRSRPSPIASPLQSLSKRTTSNRSDFFKNSVSMSPDADEKEALPNTEQMTDENRAKEDPQRVSLLHSATVTGEIQESNATVPNYEEKLEKLKAACSKETHEEKKIDNFDDEEEEEISNTVNPKFLSELIILLLFQRGKE